jgi:hypothetical protein
MVQECGLIVLYMPFLLLEKLTKGLKVQHGGGVAIHPTNDMNIKQSFSNHVRTISGNFKSLN